MEKNKNRFFKYHLILVIILTVIFVYEKSVIAACSSDYPCNGNSGICPLDPYRLSNYIQPNYEELPDGLIQESLDVEFRNCSSENVYNVSAVISCIPDGVQVVDGSVTIGDIPSGDCKWSQDYFTIIVDIIKAPKLEGICWDVTYFDIYNVKYVLEDVAKYCGEVCGEICKPTLITLKSFTTKEGNGKVVLEWVTESEIDNAGFNISRSETEKGEYKRINEFLIPAEGNAGGATYKYTDNDVKNRKTYYYMLEDLDTNGAATPHGPEKATPRLFWGMFRR